MTTNTHKMRNELLAELAAAQAEIARLKAELAAKKA
jgi:uncharacterized small protein (DUF1192 family)